ncbi:hypothetical protein ACQX8A_14715, partial [Staphylococcus aureus]|uniref:hypothetical protein n=1 Tax=Staphylococcus aureus TaxID=1280 RepID=UPI003D1D80C2
DGQKMAPIIGAILTAGGVMFQVTQEFGFCSGVAVGALSAICIIASFAYLDGWFDKPQPRRFHDIDDGSYRGKSVR